MSFRTKNIFLALLPGVLLYLAWPPRALFVLSFVAFIPVLLLEFRTRAKKGYFAYVYLSMLVFNVLTTWWVWYASAPGSIAMMLANSLLMSLPFWLYRGSIRQFGQIRALFALVCYWLAFEYLHLNWEITWPWLSLGNVFAMQPNLVQWYEITGMLGGSFWVLLINILGFRLWLQAGKKQVYALSAALLIPTSISMGILWQEQASTEEVALEETLLVQPNIDPYEKFNRGAEVQTFQDMLALLEPKIGPNTSYVVLPETAIVEYVDEDFMDGYRSIRLLNEFMKRYPHIHFITGISTYNFYEEGESLSPTARLSQDGERYESYNTSMEVDSNGVVELYHKSKLVPGVEKMPYPKIFSFLERWSVDMGGVTGSLGANDAPETFEAGSKTDLAPLICYESVFPGYVNKFVELGADLILVMTNDGWWKDTDGYKQHMHYARLRAIENRREVLRSANTGITCHINKYGQIEERTNWWEADVLKVEAKVHRAKTFYTTHGDFIGRFGAFFGVFLMLGAFVKSRVKH